MPTPTPSRRIRAYHFAALAIAMAGAALFLAGHLFPAGLAALVAVILAPP